jgi:hypothetical protein
MFALLMLVLLIVTGVARCLGGSGAVVVPSQ